jgi:tRNA-modifying protein YgfZ
VHNLGKPPRRLVMLHLDGSEHSLPAVGAAVSLGERQVGRVTTPARHHELGPIALAVIKRSTPVDAELSVDGGDDASIAAAQEVIVGA